MPTPPFKLYEVTIRQAGEPGWFTATCAEVPGAIAQGRGRKRALLNARSAIALVLGVRKSRVHVIDKVGAA